MSKKLNANANMGINNNPFLYNNIYVIMVYVCNLDFN